MKISTRLLTTLTAATIGVVAVFGTEAAGLPRHAHRTAPGRSGSEVIDYVEGKTTYYDRQSLGWYIYAGGNNLQYGPINGTAKTVDADDGFTYLQNPLTADLHGTYIRCKRTADKLTATFPQVLTMLDDITGEIPLYIGMLRIQRDDQGLTYLPVDADDTASWTVGADGSLVFDHEPVELSADGRFTGDLPQTILGTYYYQIGPDGKLEACWNAVGDWAQTYTPIQTFDITQIPAGLKVEAWQMSTKKANRMVDVAIDGNDIYIGRLTDYGPGAIKGTISGDKVSFPTQQYLGFNERVNANVWFLTAKAVYSSWDFGDHVQEFLERFDRTPALEFAYDPAASTLTSQKDDCYIINAMVTETNYYEYQEHPCLEYLHPEGMDAKPADPEILVAGQDQGDDGFYFEFTLPDKNVNGVSLNTDRMYYNVYLNGELHHFTTDIYNHFRQDLTDVPYNYSDQWDLTVRGPVHGIYFHAEGIEEIAVQSFFQGYDGRLYASRLVSTKSDSGSTTTFAYAAKDVQVEPSGTGRYETYDVAIALTNPSLAGKKITAIEIPVLPSARVSQLSVWVADQLKIELIDGKNTNIVNHRWNLDMPAEGSMQFITCELEQPYVIPAGGTYVGYSLTVDEINRLDEGSMVPIVTALGSKEGSFWLHTSKSFLQWKDRSEEFGVMAMTQVRLAGDFMVNGVSPDRIPLKYIEAGTEQTLQLPVLNLGINPVSSLDYRITVDSRTTEGHIDLADAPIPAVYAYRQELPMTMPALTATGTYRAKVEITAVNGLPNDAIDWTEFDLKVLGFLPKHLAVVEEFTGTWCGWCPRGYVAMEYMGEHYPDFIGIAYHDTDPMAMQGGYPKLVSGFPSASVNRTIATDPFYAKGENNGFTMPALWEEQCRGFVPCGIDVAATWADDNTVTATATVEWADEAEPGNYRVEYVLLADGMKGPDNDPGWFQHNYYATEPTTPGMEFFCNSPVYVGGLTFNDVAILTSGFKGVDGSVTDTTTGHRNVSTHTFKTSDAKSYDGKAMPFHRDRLRVAALLLDFSDGSEYGRVVNAAKCAVTDGSGVADITDGMQPESVVWYDLQGRPTVRPGKGVYIRSARYPDGSVRTSKVVL